MFRESSGINGITWFGGRTKLYYGDSLLNALIKLVSVVHDPIYFALFVDSSYVGQSQGISATAIEVKLLIWENTIVT